MSSPPSDVDYLKSFLEEEDFDLVEDQHEPSFFGDRRFRWQRDDMRIQLVLDRGRWFFDVSPAWFDDWNGYGLEIVLDALDDSIHFTHILPLREAIDIIEERLEELAAFISTQEGCAMVMDKRRERAHKWFGA